MLLLRQRAMGWIPQSARRCTAVRPAASRAAASECHRLARWIVTFLATAAENVSIPRASRGHSGHRRQQCNSRRDLASFEKQASGMALSAVSSEVDRDSRCDSRRPPHPTPSMIIGDVAASEWLAGPRRVLRVFPSIPLTCVLLPPGPGGPLWQVNLTPCREKTTGFSQVPLAKNA